MKHALKLTAIAAAITLAACSAEPAPLTNGEWSIDSAASDLSYVTIKSGNIAETNSFETVSGSVAADGTASVEIDLSSVSTGVDIRDERMRDIFFVVADNPTATITAQVDPASFEKLSIGANSETTIEGTVSLKGVEAPFKAEATVTRAGEDRVVVVSDKPVIIYADALGLTEGLAQLQELAGLPSITPVVPVSFSLTFAREN